MDVVDDAPRTPSKIKTTRNFFQSSPSPRRQPFKTLAAGDLKTPVEGSGALDTFKKAGLDGSQQQPVTTFGAPVRRSPAKSPRRLQFGVRNYAKLQDEVETSSSDENLLNRAQRKRGHAATSVKHTQTLDFEESSQQ
jgi:hypothetical protein